MNVKKMKVENIVMKIKAVVKNQALIRYRNPKRDVRITSTASVNTIDELLRIISRALASKSALLKFSTTRTVICCLGSQLQITLKNGMCLRTSFSQTMKVDLNSM